LVSIIQTIDHGVRTTEAQATKNAKALSVALILPIWLGSPAMNAEPLVQDIRAY
jgi:hypothetical protein